ncbi:YTH domain-containing protein ECT3-like isoform X1 [Pistacia vera]|uniref:YTH domain-containing protein ECT3-like isoform X1 n=1 Tax=Pistacia vera TaxID=55513 RepID=UPI001263AFDF|nr:YTH domain-containing protein ECT3-like isoform X1 [Pistacia vera]
MATVSASSDRILSGFSHLETADLLQNLSLDSENKTAKAYDYANKGHYADNASHMYHQGYGYSPYGIYPSPGDGQLQGLQQYQYPSPYYPPYAPQGAGSTSVTAETNNGSLSAVANGSSVSGNNGSKPLRPSYQNSNLDPNASYRRGGLSTAVPSSYHDARYSFDGIHSPTAWYDSSVFSSGGQSKHAANAGFTSSHSNNYPSGRNQNHHSHPHLMNLHHTRPTSGFGEAYDYMNPMYANNTMYGHYGNTYRAGSGFGSFGYDSWMGGRGWYTVDNKYKPRGRGYGASGSGKENGDGLNELNKGPRAKDFKNQEGFDPITLAVKGQNLTCTESDVEDNSPLVPDKEKYNGEDFAVESYVDAKFYVIKSYSEDDVHKSVKYNMWTSTPNGNKKLDLAYREVKEKSSDCPVFLLFSVNASGQFVGLAEMAGPVDFDKTVEYWQQDKWIGCFPLKWHIIKDIPNSSLRHITLENNENKPVTNSRDTQEVNFDQGIQILKIFKSHSSKRCILDDFGFYESREKIMQEKKAKQNQLPKQASSPLYGFMSKLLVLDGESDKVVSDHKDKDASIQKDNVQNEALIKDTVVTTAAPADETNGEVNKLEEDESAAAVEDAATKGSKSAVVLSGKTGSSNGVASAC